MNGTTTTSDHTDSMATPLMERTVCRGCGHFHRRALRRKCACCGRDDAKVYGTEAVSA